MQAILAQFLKREVISLLGAREGRDPRRAQGRLRPPRGMRGATAIFQHLRDEMIQTRNRLPVLCRHHVAGLVGKTLQAGKGFRAGGEEALLRLEPVIPLPVRVQREETDPVRALRSGHRQSSRGRVPHRSEAFLRERECLALPASLPRGLPRCGGYGARESTSDSFIPANISFPSHRIVPRRFLIAGRLAGEISASTGCSSFQSMVTSFRPPLIMRTGKDAWPILIWFV